MGSTFLANLSHFIPELVMVFTMMSLLLLEATFKDSDKGRPDIFWAIFFGYGVCLSQLLANLGKDPVNIFSGAVTIDSFSTLLKIVMVLGTLGAIYIGSRLSEIYSELKSEFAVLCTGVLIGGMLLSSANNMLTVYLGIETLSVLSYVLASLKKSDGKSSEAGIKYVLYGGIASGLLLFGISHIYGVLGSIQFGEIAQLIPKLTGAQTAILIPSFLFFFVGLGYKIACVPFHMWAPDVYEGSPLPVTTFFALVPKIAGIAALIRVTMVFFGSDPNGILSVSWIGLMQIIAALTITVGNVTAINQRSVKRMLAYSSISHAGMMLLGVTVLSDVGARAVVFYGITYLFMTLVAFFITGYIADTYGNDDHDRFRGLIRRYPLMALAMTVVMFSLAGLPPFSGFVAKFNIISVVIGKQYYALGFIAALNSVVSLYYYMRVAVLMILKEADAADKIAGFGFYAQSIVLVLTVPVIVLGLFWDSIMGLAGGAKLFIQ